MQNEDPTLVPKRLDQGETQTTQLRPEEPSISPGAYNMTTLYRVWDF